MPAPLGGMKRSMSARCGGRSSGIITARKGRMSWTQVGCLRKVAR
jgi:hypothetical protein